MTDLREVFAILGVSEAEIEAATEDGTLLGLAAERFLLPGERKFDQADFADRSGLDPAHLSKLWLALGFPRPASAGRTFTDADVDVIRTLLSDGTTLSDYTLHEARVISASLARIAEVFIDEMWDQHFDAGQSDVEALGEMAEATDVERIEGLLLYLLRRHIVAAIYRRLALGSSASSSGMSTVAVGFADVVGFTSLSQSFTAQDLTRLVVRFEQSTFDLVAEMHGRIVKTIGDEVMFTFADAVPAAEFSLRLAAGVEGLPPIRVGLAWGPVLMRQGDCFGPTVNLASRVVGIPDGGEVVVDPAMAGLLSDDERFELTALPPHELKGLGTVALSSLRRSG